MTDFLDGLDAAVKLSRQPGVRLAVAIVGTPGTSSFDLVATHVASKMAQDYVRAAKRMHAKFLILLGPPAYTTRKSAAVWAAIVMQKQGLAKAVKTAVAEIERSDCTDSVWLNLVEDETDYRLIIDTLATASATEGDA